MSELWATGGSSANAEARAWTVCRGGMDWTEGRGRGEIEAGSGPKESPVPGETREDRAETALPGSRGRGAGPDRAAKTAKSARRVRAATSGPGELLLGLTRAKRASPDLQARMGFQDNGEVRDSRVRLEPRVTRANREGEGDRDSRGYRGERVSGAIPAIRVYLASLERRLKLGNQEIQVRTENHQK